MTQTCRFSHWLAGAAAIIVTGAVLLGTVASPAGAAGYTRASSVQIVGAGSTFDLPFFNAAFPIYGKSHNVSVTYSGIGSGGGIKQFTNNTIDFGATDVPMNASEVAAAQANGGNVVQIPIALGGVAIAYHLPEIGKNRTLKLDGSTLANIFLGKITRWNDPAIAALNPSIHLPLTPILTIHRSDASGTNYIVTDYLSSVSPAWTSNIGKGKSVAWPASSLGGKGNPGVAAALQQHAGAIGYVELAYAVNYKIPYAQLKNKAGVFQFPSLTTVRAAAAQFSSVSATKFSIVNAPGAASYPIAGYSWVLLRQHPKQNGSALVDLFRWMTTTGQTNAGQLNYVPLPANVQKVAANDLATVK